ncbi:MAG: PQQ-binding-like beta-propeller repeat protein [Fuerstiella sp.]|nr:PQQ-binding-like beta-propeller repeat protein [Fuerstiella sp.]
MRHFHRRMILIALFTGVVGFVLPQRALCQESTGELPGGWPAFRGTPDQRGVARTSLSDRPELLWELESKDGWVGTCAIVGDFVYAPALEGYLYCLERDTGHVVWKCRSIASSDEKEFAPGFKAAPLVVGDTVYAGDEDGYLHAIDIKSGKHRWPSPFETGAEIAGGVGYWNEQLILASHDSFLYFLSLDGKEISRFQTRDRINCSPAIVDHFTFVSGCDSELRVIDLRSREEVLSVDMNDYLIASPAVVGDSLYVGSHRGVMTALNWKTGDVLWRYEGERQQSIHASAVATDDLILVGSHDKVMYAIDRETGRSRWKFATNARIDCSAAVVGSRVFFGSGDGNIYGLSLDDGKEVWKYHAGHPISAGMAIGEKCMVVGEDTSGGRLLCFQ